MDRKKKPINLCSRTADPSCEHVETVKWFYKNDNCSFQNRTKTTRRDIKSSGSNIVTEGWIKYRKFTSSDKETWELKKISGGITSCSLDSLVSKAILSGVTLLGAVPNYNAQKLINLLRNTKFFRLDNCRVEENSEGNWCFIVTPDKTYPETIDRRTLISSAIKSLPFTDLTIRSNSRIMSQIGKESLSTPDSTDAAKFVPLAATTNLNYYGKLVNLRGSVGVQDTFASPVDIECPNGYLEIKSLKTRLKVGLDPLETRAQLRFFISKPFSPLVFSLDLDIGKVTSTNGQEVVLNLKFPLTYECRDLDSETLLSGMLNIWLFTEFENEKGVKCMNFAGVSNLQLGRLDNTSSESKTTFSPLFARNKTSSGSNFGYITSLDLIVPYLMSKSPKGSIEIASVQGVNIFDRDSISKPKNPGPSPDREGSLILKNVTGAKQHIDNLETFFSKLPASYSFLENVRTYSYETNGMIPAVLYFYNKLFKFPNAPGGRIEFLSINGNSQSASLSMEYELWKNLSRIAVNRFYHGSDGANIESFLKDVTRKQLSLVLATSLVLYSNYCYYNGDYAFTYENSDTMSRRKLFKKAIEWFTFMSATDIYDCEDGTRYIAFLANRLRVLNKYYQWDTNSPEERLLSKLAGILEEYYCFVCLGAVSRESYTADGSESLGIEDQDLVKMGSSAQAHEFAVLIPRSLVQELLLKFKGNPSNDLVIDPNESSKGEDLEILVCESTGSVHPLCLPSSEEWKYLQYEQLDTHLPPSSYNKIRGHNYISTEESPFYRSALTLITSDFEFDGKQPVMEITCLLYRNSNSLSAPNKNPASSKPIVDGSYSSLNGWTYGIPFADLIRKKSPGTHEIGFWCQNPISDQLLANSQLIIDNDYPIRLVAPVQYLPSDSLARQDLEKIRNKIDKLKSSLSSQKRLMTTVPEEYLSGSMLVRIEDMTEMFPLIEQSLLRDNPEALVNIHEELVCLTYDDKLIRGGYFFTIAKKNGSFFF